MHPWCGLTAHGIPLGVAWHNNLTPSAWRVLSLSNPHLVVCGVTAHIVHQHIALLAAVLPVHNNAVRRGARLLPVIGKFHRKHLIPRQLPQQPACRNSINLQQWRQRRNETISLLPYKPHGHSRVQLYQASNRRIAAFTAVPVQRHTQRCIAYCAWSTHALILPVPCLLV